MGKVKREDYFPNEDGLIIFKNQVSWSETGYSVYEMLELLKKYRDRIHHVQFEACDGSMQNLVNLYESDAYSNNGEYSCVLIIGDGNKVIEQVGKVNNKIYIEGMLFPQLHQGFNRQY